MKIANIQTPTDMTISKNSVEPNTDEFTQVLSKVVTKESEGKKETTKTESEDENKEVELEDSLVAMLNLPFVEIKSSEAIPLELDTLIIGEKPVTIEEGISKENLQIVDNNVELLVNENKFNVDKTTNNFVPLLDEDLKLDEEPILSKDNILPEKKEELLSLGQNKALHDVVTELKDHDHKEIPRKIDGLDFKEVSVDVEPKEKLVANENKNVNYLEHPQVKEFNQINSETKIESQNPVLSHDNLQKVNDTIIQLMETTTEGDTKVLKVKLYPEDLGVVDVTLRMEEGKLTAKILVDNDYVKGLFTSSVNELNESLVKQNIRLEKINIDLNLNSNSSNNPGFDLNQNGSFNQSRRYNSRNQLKMFNSKVESTIINESSNNTRGAISILA